MTKTILQMEMTIEQKEKRSEYMKDYRAENREKLNASSREYYEQHRSYYQNYYHNYYLEHREKILETARKWREEHKGDYVYFYIDTDGHNIYIGSTGGRPFIERNSFHLNSHSNLQMSAGELVENYDLSIIVYKDFTKYNLNRQDLFFIENYFKEKYGQLLDGNKVYFNEELLSKTKEELELLAEEIDYQEFNKLHRYLN